MPAAKAPRRKVPRRRNKTQRNQRLVADFLAGVPSHELTAKYGISRQRISSITTAAGVRRDRVAEQPPSVKRMLAEAPALAAEGLTRTAAARRLGVLPESLSRLVAKHMPDLEWTRHRPPRSAHVQRMIDEAPALAAEGLSKTDAARRLGVAPATFTSMMHRHLLDLEWHDGRHDGRGGRKKRRARR